MWRDDDHSDIGYWASGGRWTSFPDERQCHTPHHPWVTSKESFIWGHPKGTGVHLQACIIPITGLKPKPTALKLTDVRDGVWLLIRQTAKVNAFLVGCCWRVVDNRVWSAGMLENKLLVVFLETMTGRGPAMIYSAKCLENWSYWIESTSFESPTNELGQDSRYPNVRSCRRPTAAMMVMKQRTWPPRMIPQKISAPRSSGGKYGAL